MSDAVQKYAELKKQIDELQEQLDACKGDAMKAVEEAGGKLEGNGFVASRRSRTSWTYSENVEKLKSDLKDLRKEEEQKGIAEKKEESSFLVLKFA